MDATRWGLKPLSLAVSEWFNENCPRKWLGRGSRRGCPPPNPDLTPLNFFLCGCLKNIAYLTPIENVEDLIHRIREATTTINGDMWGIQTAIISKVMKCLKVGGRNFEHLEIYKFVEILIF